ncbi:MAG: hypothetical protein JKY14_00860 [Paraglaciecola sp.]|nr:hypothetical protein [Paraglaciecola sp.]
MRPKRSIRQDPDIMSLLSSLPCETALTLTDTQLKHLKIVIGSGQYRKHKVDMRGTFPVPFYPSRIYFVFLMGRNIRSLSRQEQTIALTTMLLLTTLFLMFSSIVGLVIVYIIKSALGINLLDGFSLGLWDYIKSF